MTQSSDRSTPPSGALIDFLREEELYDDAIIVFTSDHGEEFGERGFVGWHAHTLYDELLHVPLLVKLPGAAHAGAAPTILAALDLDAPVEFEGVSLLGPLSGSGSVPEHAVSRKDVLNHRRFRFHPYAGLEVVPRKPVPPRERP